MNQVNEAAERLGYGMITGFDIMDPAVFFGLLVGTRCPPFFRRC